MYKWFTYKNSAIYGLRKGQLGLYKGCALIGRIRTQVSLSQYDYFFCWVDNRLLHVSRARVKCLHLLRRWESKLVLLREPRLQYHSTKETRHREYSSTEVVGKSRAVQFPTRGPVCTPLPHSGVTILVK